MADFFVRITNYGRKSGIPAEELHARLRQIRGAQLIETHDRGARILYGGSVDTLRQELCYEAKLVIIEPVIEHTHERV